MRCPTPSFIPEVQGRYASLLRGIRIINTDGDNLGELLDFVAEVEGPGHPHIRGIIVRSKGTNRCFPTDAVRMLDYTGGHITADLSEHPQFERRNGELLIIKDLLDAEVIDRDAIRVLRVNDAVIDVREGALTLVGIDASASGLARRLVPRWLGQRFVGKVLDWDRIELLTADISGANIRLSREGLMKLHPADIAKLIDHLSYRVGADLLCALDSGIAADILEEVEKRRQPEILEFLPQDRAVAILNLMAPDAAADLLQNVFREKSDTLICLMETKASADIQLLLSYPHDTAAGLMTTDFVIALEDETAREALVYIRDQLRRPDLIYYIYIVNNADERSLRGVISLRDLLLAEPSQPLRTYMRGMTRTVRPNESCKEVARIMGEYNLLALPVVGDAGEIIGLVTADDVLDVILPESTRRHLPRLFS